MNKKYQIPLLLSVALSLLAACSSDPGTPDHEHVASSPKKENEIPVSCDVDGSYDNVIYCSYCHQELSRVHKTIPAVGHRWGEPTYTWATNNSTCTAKAVCSRDETHILEETVKPTIVPTSESTCTWSGTGTVTATFTNAKFETQTKTNTYLPLKEHQFELKQYVWYDDGSEYINCKAEFECQTCHYTHETVESTSFTSEVIKAPTENEEGIKKYTATFSHPSLSTQTKQIYVAPTVNKYARYPIISDDYKTVQYGLYPQTVVDNLTTIAALNLLTKAEGNGWYLYNGDYYAKEVAKPYSSSYTFLNGETIVNGTEYWFKCEPIAWTNLGGLRLFSKYILDAHRYNQNYQGTNTQGVYSNNYEHSEIRSWLNGEFHDKAFYLCDGLTVTSTVSNAKNTTDSTVGPYYGNTTYDKLYLLSYKELISASNGFETNPGSMYARQAYTTDYARARGVQYKNDNVQGAPGIGYYLTRSAYNQDQYKSATLRDRQIYYVKPFGDLVGTECYVHNPNMGIRPAMLINPFNNVV